MIRDIEGVSETNFQSFLRKVRSITNDFQNNGLEVEIQYAVTEIEGNYNETHYTAMIIARQKNI